jgi:hypothetical protein
MSNKSLNNAKEAKNDEFYTLMDDIENEISKYDLKQFKNKIIYCNCDDPTWSNFFKFFIKWGNKLQLKEVHFTNYANAKRKFKQLTLFEKDDLKESISDDKRGIAHHWIYSPKTNKIIKKELKGNGDFRSDECKKILEKSDIVITNPPFSIFNEFLLLLVKYKKQYLIISDENKISNKDIFPLIKENKLWLGYNRIKKFLQPDGKYQNFGNKCWFTNLDVLYRHQPMILHKQDLTNFKKYDNYDAIEVNETRLIPDNYYKKIGVYPGTFLFNYCPKQFDIIGLSGVDIKIKKGRFYVDNFKKRLPARLIIRRKNDI